MNNTALKPLRSVGRRLLAVSAMAGLMGATLALPGKADTPERGGTLGLSVQLTTASLDPLYGNAAGADRTFLNLYAEQLVFQNGKYDFEPGLAESWEFQNDGKSLLFRLRQGVRFQDGTPFNAAAVKFNFERLMNPSIEHRKRASAELFESVDVIDDYTVRVNFKVRSALSLVRIASAEGSICSPKAIAELGEDFGRRPVCTGPFKMTSWSGNQFIAKRNPDYWQKGTDGKPLPYLDEVQITVQPNSAVRLVELRSGNVQFIDYLLPKDFDQITKNADLALLDTGKGMLEYIAFNVSKPPFNNRDLREAASLAINREALVKVVAPTVGSVLRYVESPEEMWVYDPSVVGHSYNLERAREAFRKSGFNGEVSLMVIQRDPDIQIAQLVQGMFASIGLKMKIEVVERQGFLDKMNSLRHDFLIARMEHNVDPDNLYSQFFDKSGVFNVTGVDRTETTRLVQQARGELDREIRRSLYRQVTDSVLKDYIYSWLIRIPYQAAVSKRLQNISLDANKSLTYDKLWLKK
ncbi:ABC transporter substrate-binding protein [Chelatococcus asaccharovorans]|uniref:ABC transporter substrate-binding protein n=1 Tax=Chelatococcus asaccharovorans TaxID=28210 RepID=UPI00224C6E5F|nr:ABC transporter substrate-binding protein [Chelatococcus asaccharovorans]CAH1650186.1 Peptide/nickel transport system substrate-binding protein [Chelatococcus asaccharovorans]CAH1692101.1 Peptide/nickel transport system substrate-binding protein [Chelatococcus asaccharovorans]